MPTYTCTCGARYRLPDDAGGKRVKCKKCGHVFTIPRDEDTVPVAPLADGDYGYFRKEVSRPPMAKPTVDAAGTGTALTPRPELDETVARGREAAAQVRPQRSFTADVVWTFLLFTDPGNLITLVLLGFLHAIMPVLGLTCFGWIGLIIIYGWLCAFWFNVISEAAGGEESLPRIGMSEGVFEDVIRPLFSFLGATAVAASPIIVCSLVAAGLGLPFSLDNPGPIEIVTIGASLFCWPMVLLVVAVGGFNSLLRVDLLLATIGRTFLPYLGVCVLVGTTAALQSNAVQLARAVFTGGGGLLVTFAVAPLLQAYFGVVSMRIVGLYYHHFKKRFAWSWE